MGTEAFFFSDAEITMLSSSSFLTIDIFFPMNSIPFTMSQGAKLSFSLQRMGTIRAAIFDMDGLLIDSEPLWQEAVKKVFTSVGIQLTTEMCLGTMGMRLDEVVQHWHGKFPWSNRTLKEVEEDVLAEVSALIRAKGRPMRGVGELILLLKNKGIRLAVASSSYLLLIETVLERFNIRHFFDAVQSAQFERKGKPHPDIYLSTAKTLGIPPAECMAFEDSYNGVLSAKAAGMFTIAIPDPAFFEDPRFEKADLKLRSLADFDEKILEGT